MLAAGLVSALAYASLQGKNGSGFSWGLSIGWLEITLWLLGVSLLILARTGRKKQRGTL
jgi:hypothetical protein